MKRLRMVVVFASALIFLICVYTFLLGNEVFKGKFANDGISWYFLAKGLFCSIALYLLVSILEQLRVKK